MPTVLRIGGLRVVIYPNDHRPPHVHVLGPGAEAVFELADSPTLRRCFGFTTADLGRIERALVGQVETLREEWERIHGDH